MNWTTGLKISVLIGVIGLLAVPPLPPVAAQTDTKSPPPTVMKIKPQALALLKAMSERLSQARSLSFTAITIYESASRLGPALAYTTLTEVTLQRPNLLRIISPGDGPANEFYYDGKTITAYSPQENLVAVAPAPSSINAALKLAYVGAAFITPSQNPKITTIICQNTAPGQTRPADPQLVRGTDLNNPSKLALQCGDFTVQVPDSEVNQ
jgi:hypothetical protein